MQDTKRILTLFLLVMILVFVGGKSFALAQGESEPTGFRNVQLFLFPEYDDPRLLVMLQGHIEGGEAPAEVRFMVPRTAEMYSAGSLDAQGVYSGGPPDRQPSEVPGWDEISYEVTSTVFRVEYYDPIILGSPDKSISYDFRWLYPVSKLDVVIQQPRTALDFIVTPSSTQGFLDSEGLNSYLNTYNDLDGESSLHFDVTYYKPDNTLSVEASSGTATGTTLIIIGGAILVLVVVAFLWFRSRSAPHSRASRRRAGVARAPRSSVGKARERYCTQCGKLLDGSFKFCPDCGSNVS
ncbi:hypothetical protein ACFLVJ_01410 [Chloroflexota bacterium]